MPADSPLKRNAAASQTTHWEQRKKPKKRADSALVENLNIADLRPYMHLTLEQAADELKVGTTVLKRIARKCGIPKWPSRQIGWLNLKIEAVSGDVAMASPSTRSELQQQLSKLVQARDEVYATGKVATGFIKQWNARQSTDGHASEDDTTSDAEDAFSSSPQTSTASTPSTSSCIPCTPNMGYLPEQQGLVYGNMMENHTQCIDIAEPAVPFFYNAYPAVPFFYNAYPAVPSQQLPQQQQQDWLQQTTGGDLPDVHFDMDELDELNRILMTFVEDDDLFDFDF